jgi:hypothetical protein
MSCWVCRQQHAAAISSWEPLHQLAGIFQPLQSTVELKQQHDSNQHQLPTQPFVALHY